VRGSWSKTWAGACLRASSDRSCSSWTFVFMETRSCVPAVATRTQTRIDPSPPTSLYRWRGGPRCPKCDQSPNSAACECRWRRTWLQRAHCNASAASASATRSETADTRSGASCVGAPTSLVRALPRGSCPSAAAEAATTRRSNAAVLSGKRRRRRLQSERPRVSERIPPRATPPL
jgi:hypothetical protein